MTIKLLWRDKETRQSFFSALMIIAFIILFWIFLYVGISSEVDRRSDIPKDHSMKWAHEKGYNQWQTEQRQASK